MNITKWAMIATLWGCNLLTKPTFAQVEKTWNELADKMVKTQLVKRGIQDQRVLQAMRHTPRHRFVPPPYTNLAYEDGPLPIGHDQTISQPYIVAIMTELLDLQGDEKVLEIGTGSGYQAAILAQLVDECYTIEIVKPLADRSAALLNEMGYSNVSVHWGDGYKGWPEHAPFDCIIVTAAPKKIPPALVDQLAVGGRMVLPVGSFYQELILVTKTEKGITRKDIIPVRFVPMVHPKEN